MFPEKALAFTSYYSDMHFCGLEFVFFILSDSPWKVHLSNVGPEMTGVTVGGLTPARTYQFRVCAVNEVGRGQYSAETSRCVNPAPGGGAEQPGA